jgi:tRNA (adenine22-N1)-methyltransferase
VADVGCDHGYLGIYLLKKQIAGYIYAGDVNEGPLQSAVHNAEKYEVSGQISFYLSDGLRNFPRDFDTLVCAGMGADTMVSVLEAAPWLKDSRYTLILQCQSKTHFLRNYLSQQGYHIQAERVVRDGRFLYTVMKIIYSPGNILTPGQIYFSPALMDSPELPEYYQQIVFRLRRAIQGQKEQADPVMVAALQELENDPKLQHLKECQHGNG